MSQRARRPQKRPKHLEEYVLGTNKHSKSNDKKNLEEHSQGQEHSKPAKSAMECSDENITFIPPNEVSNAGAPVDEGTPNEGVGNFNIHGGVPTLPTQTRSKPQTISSGMI